MKFIHEHIILPVSDVVKGERVYSFFRFLSQVETWNEKQKKAFQEKKIRELVAYIAMKVPYYREWFSSNHLSPQGIRSVDDLRILPIVNKALMRNEGIERFTALCFPNDKRILSRSSGSTGEPFSFYVSKEAYSINIAAKLRTWYQAGYHLGDRYMKVTNGVRVNKIKVLQDCINNCVYLPFYSITEETLVSILCKIEQKKPLFIRSYPAPLYLLAKYRNCHSGYCHCPRRIFTTGSTLTVEYRREIETAFGCDVIDSYSCEGTPNTYETLVHDGYHVTDAYGIIEVLDGQNQPVTNGVGRVVSTDFWNLAHPFVRYDTQDLVEVHDGQIMRIMGRDCETMLEASGKMLTVHNFTHYFADNFPSVDGWQIAKKKDDGVEIRLVVNDLYDSTAGQQIVNYWSNSLGIPVRISILDELPLMNNNKRILIVDE